MKKALCLIIAAVIAAAAYMAWVRYVSERSIVIISTTDVHAKVENFPRLATAIARCRDTVATIVADAGDRWTGNAYVDMAREPRRPVIDMMNAMGYDVARSATTSSMTVRRFWATSTRSAASTWCVPMW